MVCDESRSGLHHTSRNDVEEEPVAIFGFAGLQT